MPELQDKIQKMKDSGISDEHINAYFGDKINKMRQANIDSTHIDAYFRGGGVDPSRFGFGVKQPQSTVGQRILNPVSQANKTAGESLQSFKEGDKVGGVADAVTAAGEGVSAPLNVALNAFRELGKVGDVVYNKIGLPNIGSAVTNTVANAIESPFRLLNSAAEGIQAGLDAIGIPKDVQNLGLPEKTAQKVNRAVQTATPFAAIPVAGKLGVPAITKAAEVIEPALKSAARPIASPFAKQVNPETIALAKKYGVELPASSLTKSHAVPLIEAVAGKGLFGDRLSDVVDNAGKKLNQIADNTVQSFNTSVDPVEVGKTLAEGQNAFETNFRQTKEALYDKAKISHGQISVNPEQGLKQIKNIVDELNNVVGKKPPVLNLLTSLQKGLVDGIDATKVRATIRDLDTKINYKNPNPITQGYEGQLKGVVHALRDDLDGAIKTARPELGQALDEANGYYKDGIKKLNSGWGRKINQYIQEGRTAELPSAILNKSTPIEWIPKILETVGEEGAQSLRATTLSNIFDKARGSNGTFTSDGIARQIRQYGNDRLNTVFGQDITQKISDLSKLSEAWGKGQKISGGSQTAFVGRIIGELLGAAISPVVAVKFLLGDAAFSKFVSSPMGQKWLTTGLVDRPIPIEAKVHTNLAPTGLPPLNTETGQPVESTPTEETRKTKLRSMEE